MLSLSMWLPAFQFELVQPIAVQAYRSALLILNVFSPQPSNGNTKLQERRANPCASISAQSNTPRRSACLSQLLLIDSSWHLSSVLLASPHLNELATYPQHQMNRFELFRDSWFARRVHTLLSLMFEPTHMLQTLYMVPA